MPEENYQWLQRAKLLSFEELTRLTSIFTDLGVDRVRLTGGEPLLRKDLHLLIAQLKALNLTEIAMTTNGVLLEKFQAQLFQAGLDRITLSLDAVDPKIFQQMSQRDDLDRVLAGLKSVSHSSGLKIDSVVIKGTNESQLVSLLELGAEHGAEVRFIEYMDVGGATRWTFDQVLSSQEILERLTAEFGIIESLPGRGSAPAQRYRLPTGQVFGIIASTTQPFCSDCDRLRVTADGQLLTCLYAKTGSDMRRLLRGQDSDHSIREKLSKHWALREDRGAEKRLELTHRGPLANVEQLQENVHLEMHTRGG